jgi:signal transduction histidine kinase
MQSSAFLKETKDHLRPLHIVSRENAEDARDEFVALASHELKTPLTSLLLEVDLHKRRIQRGKENALSLESVFSMMERIDHHAWQLNQLIEDMLDSAKLSNEKMELCYDEVNLGLLVRSVVSRNNRELRATGSALELNIDPSVVGYWDSQRIEQVVHHLYINAVKYGGGQLIRVAVSQADDVATLKVTDHGIGIPSDSLERIFGRFERAVSGDHISGLGLGLYITRKIVEMHDGQILAESVLGLGSVFTVTLPINKGSVN